MSTLWAIIQVIGIVGAFSCCAATNEIERAIASFPRIDAEEFRPDKAVQSANTLIRAGKGAACVALESFANARRERDINEKVCLLCRLVFTRTNSSEFLEAPRLGMSQFLPYESLKPPEWPDMPFAIINDVPLSVNLGYAGSGIMEQGEQYLAYCKANGTFRTQPFPEATSLTASNALNRLFNSAAWKALKWSFFGHLGVVFHWLG
jgi:hypothetical protein